MRIHILRALFVKEFRRHVANRGGIALGLLLVAAAIMLSVFNPAGLGAGGSSETEGGTGVVGGVHHCFIYYTRDDDDLLAPILDHLENRIPAELLPHIRIRKMSRDRIHTGIQYSPGTASIRITAQSVPGQRRLMIEVFHPPGTMSAMAPYESWLFRELRVGLQEIAEQRLQTAGVNQPLMPTNANLDDDLWAVRESFTRLQDEVERLKPGHGRELVPSVEISRQGLGGQVLELRSAIATALVVFALYFACVYLLPTMNCEERERGVLLAQALSPASPGEILMAKFLFYPLIGGALAATIAGIYKPGVLSTLFFWMGLLTVAGGFLGIGMTIATLARTQRAAFMGAMCYLLSVSLVLIIASTNGIPVISNFALEYHVPRVLHAALSGTVQSSHWLHLLAAMGLAAIWLCVAGWLFRRRGWQ